MMNEAINFTLMTSHNFWNATHACAPKTPPPGTSPHKKQLFSQPCCKRCHGQVLHEFLSFFDTAITKYICRCGEQNQSKRSVTTKQQQNLDFRLARTCLVNGRDALLMQVVFHEDKRYLSSTQRRSAQKK